MSKVAIVGDPSGTGTFTISAPNGNTDRTLVLPNEAGTIITTAGVPASAMPAGSVIQTVSASNSSYSTTVSTSFVDSPLSASITPTSASSKILILCSLNGVGKSNASTSAGGNYRIIRDASTQVIYLMNGAGWNNTTTYNFPSISCSYLDSPSTTSPITYKVQFSSQTASASAQFNWYDTVQSTTSTLTLVEIAG